jgi:hypothetical protein
MTNLRMGEPDENVAPVEEENRVIALLRLGATVSLRIDTELLTTGTFATVGVAPEHTHSVEAVIVLVPTRLTGAPLITRTVAIATVVAGPIIYMTYLE